MKMADWQLLTTWRENNQLDKTKYRIPPKITKPVLYEVDYQFIDQDNIEHTSVFTKHNSQMGQIHNSKHHDVL